MNESAREVVLMVRKNTLWRVPVFCVFAGLAAFRAAVSLLVRFAFVKMPDGSVEQRESVDIGLTIDERLAEGYYYSGTVKLFKHLIENPELLERPLSEEVEM